MKLDLAALARATFVLCAFAAGTYLVVSKYADIAQALSRVAPRSLILLAITVAGYVLLSWGSWAAALRLIAPEVSVVNTVRMFFVGQLGKYLPGGVWPFIGVAELGRDLGLERRTTFASLALAIFTSLATGAIIAMWTVPHAFGIVVAPAVLLTVILAPLILALWRPARELASRLVGSRITGPPAYFGVAAVLSVGAWLLAGCQIAVLADGIAPGSTWSSIGSATGAYALAWIAGFLVMIAPAGFGAREAVLIALLSSSMSVGQATAVALLSRIAMTVADFAAAGLALAFSARRAARGAS